MPGAARQQVTLFCVAQNTSNQTKGHPAAPALLAAFGLTVKLGGCATRPSGVQTPHPTAELEQCSPSSQFGRQTEAAQKETPKGSASHFFERSYQVTHI